MEDSKDPIYFVVEEFKVDEIHLIFSDEGNRAEDKSIDNHIQDLQKHFNRINKNIGSHPLIMQDIHKNIYYLAQIIITRYFETESDIILDLSGGRTGIVHALSQAGNVVMSFCHQMKQESVIQRLPKVICAIKSKDQDLYWYQLPYLSFPSTKARQLLEHYTENLTQDQLSRELAAKYTGWKTQGTVSKIKSELVDLGLIKTKFLTENGKIVQQFLKDINNSLKQ
jgi:hypothetical protein